MESPSEREENEAAAAVEVEVEDFALDSDGEKPGWVTSPALRRQRTLFRRVWKSKDRQHPPKKERKTFVAFRHHLKKSWCFIQIRVRFCINQKHFLHSPSPCNQGSIYVFAQPLQRILNLQILKKAKAKLFLPGLLGRRWRPEVAKGDEAAILHHDGPPAHRCGRRALPHHAVPRTEGQEQQGDISLGKLRYFL